MFSKLFVIIYVKEKTAQLCQRWKNFPGVWSLKNEKLRKLNQETSPLKSFSSFPSTFLSFLLFSDFFLKSHGILLNRTHIWFGCRMPRHGGSIIHECRLTTGLLKIYHEKSSDRKSLQKIKDIFQTFFFFSLANNKKFLK